MKVAIVCDWLVTYAGAERALEQMLKCYPDADLFAVVDFLPQGQRGFIMDKPVTTTCIQHYPFARRLYQKYLFKMPLAIEQLDLSSYDLVISSSHAVAKGVITGPNQLHLCYIHTPIRYAWDMQNQYLEESGLTRGLLSWAARRMLFAIRQWDVRTANGAQGVEGVSARSHSRLSSGGCRAIRTAGAERGFLLDGIAPDAVQEGGSHCAGVCRNARPEAHRHR
jgi:hypothetical protein